MNLKNKIQHLINLKREGTFWDFKHEPHTNRIDLLHDILSLANADHEGDRFIIIGVSNSTHEIIGVVKGQENRK